MSHSFSFGLVSSTVRVTSAKSQKDVGVADIHRFDQILIGLFVDSKLDYVQWCETHIKSVRFKNMN